MKLFPYKLKVEGLLSEPMNGFLNPQRSPLSRLVLRSGPHDTSPLPPLNLSLPPFPCPAKGLTLCRGKPFKPHHFCNKLYQIIALANFCGCLLCKLPHFTLSSSFFTNFLTRSTSSQTVVSNPQPDRALCPFPFHIFVRPRSDYKYTHVSGY